MGNILTRPSEEVQEDKVGHPYTTHQRSDTHRPLECIPLADEEITGYLSLIRRRRWKSGGGGNLTAVQEDARKLSGSGTDATLDRYGIHAHPVPPAVLETDEGFANSFPVAAGMTKTVSVRAAVCYLIAIGARCAIAGVRAIKNLSKIIRRWNQPGR